MPLSNIGCGKTTHLEHVNRQRIEKLVCENNCKRILLYLHNQHPRRLPRSEKRLTDWNLSNPIPKLELDLPGMPAERVYPFL